ncbi:barstar family protein [Advenella sp. WQ 585]|uniref:Barstar family protein n=1 Tax=Advenella mandrilli TaxID=2800330 RepID=A0ABS1EBV6_9BURK|nr:barstar family protein [Advenella mandrilli]MBK1781071.1 barstar family protein [Advenella mandrilli]MDY0271715.1 barstar family protein [Advenella sp.]
MSVKSSSISARRLKKVARTVRLCELSRISNIDEVYDLLQLNLKLPQYFGRNLDALYDSLSTDVKGPFKIVWFDHASSADALGEIDYEGLIDVLRAVASERDDVEVVLG